MLLSGLNFTQQTFALLSIVATAFSLLMSQILTWWSSEPDAIMFGLVGAKSTLHVRFLCPSNLLMRFPV